VASCSRNQQLLMAWAIMEIRGGEPRRGLEVLRRADLSRRGRHEPLLDLWARTAKSLGEEKEAERIEREMDGEERDDEREETKTSNLI